MSEPLVAGAEETRTAGALLKAAREREGLHLAVLAATIKVAPAKLAALEQGRYNELPNATFARALAQSVCRSLKIDPRPVLALLPQVENAPLERAMGKLNTPFQERPSRNGGDGGLAWASKPMFVAGGLLLVAAVVVALLPSGWTEGWSSASSQPADAAASVSLSAALPAPVTAMAEAAAPVVAEAASAVAAAASAAVDASSAVLAGVASVQTSAPVTAPTSPVTPAAAPEAAASAAAMPLLRLTATAASWVEVQDGQGQTVFSRTLARGEAATLDARPPLRVLVGNASATTMTYRGQVTDLAPHTRNNVARIELR